MSFSAFFKSPSLSDAKVVIQIPRGPSKCEPPVETEDMEVSGSWNLYSWLTGARKRRKTSSDIESVVGFPAHTIIFAGSSDYFTSLVQQWKLRQSRHVLDINLLVSNCQVEAAEILVEYMYTQKLPEELSDETLLRVIEVACKFGVHTCLDSCVQHLLAPPESQATDSDLPHDVDLPSSQQVKLAGDTLLDILSWPDSLRQVPMLAPLMHAAERSFADNFHQLDAMFTSPPLLDTFKRLPVQFVQAVLTNPDIVISSENTILIAAILWLSHNPHHEESSNPHALTALQCVKYPYLSSSFLSTIVHLLPWYDSIKHLVVPAVQYQAAPAAYLEPLSRIKSTGPSAYQFIPRPGMKPPPFSFSWKLSLEDLESAAADSDKTGQQHVIRSPAHYCKGVWLHFVVRCYPADAVAQASSTSSSMIRKAAQRKVFGGLVWDLPEGVFTGRVSSLLNATNLSRLAGSHLLVDFQVAVGGGRGRRQEYQSTGVPFFRSAWGWSNLLQGEGGESEGWEGFADKEGNIEVQVTVHDVS